MCVSQSVFVRVSKFREDIVLQGNAGTRAGGNGT